MRVVRRTVEYANEWLTVVAKEVSRGGRPFYGVSTHPYIAVLAMTPEGLIPLVRLYRPVVEAVSVELPSGGGEPGESPEETARRELLEETGCEAGALQLVGGLFVDTGRMETIQWLYFAPGARVVRDPDPGAEEELETLFVTPAELRDLVVRGEIRSAAHLGAVAHAVALGYVDWL
jgi:ADP-ribose pyrophosphatase